MSSFSKTFNIPFETVLRKMSYANVYMYNRTIPSYNFDKKDKDKKTASKAKEVTPKAFFSILKERQNK